MTPFDHSAMADDEFSAAITALSSAFGDPTRRSIYLYLRNSPSKTVTEIAEEFHLHPNVVRHHLERLVSSSHVVVEAPSPSSTVGRPAKRYSCADDDLAVELGSRRDDLLVALLERALDLLGPEAEFHGDGVDAPWLDGFLFALAGPIYAGTNEIQRDLIAIFGLGMPRSLR